VNEQGTVDVGLDVSEVQAELDLLDTPGVDSEEEAALHKYVRLHARIDAEEEAVKAQFAAILRNLDNRRKGLDYVMGGLAKSVTERMLVGKKQKSLKLPWGTVGFRTSATKLDVEDPETVIGAAKEDPSRAGWIRIKEEVNRTALTDYFKSTGEIPPGCKVIDEHQTFYVKGPKVEAGTD